MATIDMVELDNIESRWGVKAGDYNITLNSRTEMMDFQDLMVKFSKNRAVAVEGEVEPLTVRIQQRNARLDSLGRILAALTELQARYPSDDENDDTYDLNGLTDGELNILWDLINDGGPKDVKFYRYECEEALQLVKSEIDGLNNEAQTDMTRLQSLVDRRDESYSTATNLMTSISDTRSNVIRNM